MASDPPRRWTTTAARVSPARRLGLPHDHSMQDREWEVADASRPGEFLDAYSSGPFDEDERPSPMEMPIQCVGGMDPASVEATPRWRSVAALPMANPGLHASSARYWSCLGGCDLEGWFPVPGPMRAIWVIIRRAWDGDGGMADR